MRPVLHVLVLAAVLTEEPAARSHALVLAAAPAPPAPNPANPYTEVSASPVAKQGSGSVVAEGKYLIASFPNLRQVAYCILPDNVWRPLVIGTLTSPKGLAIDTTNHLLFVADLPENKIYKYKLVTTAEGFLKTDNTQLLALEGYSVNWMAVSGIGDLYFTGKKIVNPPASSYDAVFRLDYSLIAKGNTLQAVEIYSRSTTGAPFSKVWMPSGLAVDTFYIYWGNQEMGSAHGTIVKGQRQNVGGRSTASSLLSMSTAQDEVRGMTATPTALYYLTPGGVYGVSKNQATTVTDSSEGLIMTPPGGDSNAKPFDPKSIAWDGGETAYFTDFTTGAVYSFPVNELKLQPNLSKFVDAPGVHGVTVFTMASNGHGRNRRMVTVLAGMLLTCVSTFIAFVR